MNEMKWVPGFIWVTPRGCTLQRYVDGRSEWDYQQSPPMLIAVNQITDLRPHKRTPEQRDIVNTCVSLCGTPDTFVDVVETVEEIAELIRQEWEGRVSLQAEIRRAVESGEAE